jgi:hypothetical protein
MALHHTLPIYKVTFDLFGVVTQMTKNMPREHKTSIGGRIRDECLALVTLVYRANCAVDKSRHLDELLERIQVAELLTRLSRDMKLISTKQYSAVIDLTDKAGRQANGWRKHSANALALDNTTEASGENSNAQPRLF